ncbi:Integrase, catalytic core [Metarhizium robertsii ARSEF 23]|uniref:Integrase, catalytic core n=1 Tax=Metarhizium robertsii (strain ARSEF 23 / ATCC MYA-3075) TaxID=655844 RepID=E9EJ31_METRA|nr:Integrase, catalytic core [Metarhizium robertsii ARSEF 23]EFZ03308.2 Integrase, catalytic core [Metarhizium robertsii ARSEF 23]
MLKKGPGNTSVDKWLSRWPTVVSNAKRYKIENLSESQICDAFIEASREINSPFYNYMKSKEAQVENERRLIKETAKTMERISNALLTALNEINPDHASSASITVATSTESEEDDPDEDVDITIVQKAQNTVNRAIKTFRKLNPNLSDQKITIGFCIKQFRTMAPPKEKATRGRAAHATLQGKKHNHDSDSQNEEDQPQQKRQRAEPSSPNTSIRNCVCGMSHKYAECYYLNPSKAPEGWVPIVQVQSKVITALKGSRRIRTNIERSFKRSSIDLPQFWPSSTMQDQPKRPAEDDTSHVSAKQGKSRAAFATHKFAFSTSTNDEYQDYFRLDNCADTHVCNDLSRFTKYKPLYDETIQFGNSGTYITGTGSQQGLYFNTRTCWMEYSDGSNAFKVTKHGAFRVVEPHIMASVFKAESHETAAQSFAMATKSRMPQVAIASMDIWHARLGHIRKETLKHIPQAVHGVALGTRNFERESELCPECQLGQARQQISRVPTWRGTYPFEKIHLDLIDLDEAFNADSWVAHFYCDYSAYHVPFNLPNKTQEEILSVTQEFLAITNDNWGFTTRYIQSDGEKGLGKKWKDFIIMKGITFNPSPPDTPDQNGLAERSGGVIMTIARKLRIQGNLPQNLWPYIVAHATRLLNRIPVQRKHWQTPFEMVHGRKPNLSHLKIIGSLAYVLIKSKKIRPARAKLQENALMGWLVGLEATNIYKIWIPQLDRVIASRDVQIDEKVMYKPEIATALPDSRQSLSTTINEIDLDEEDMEALPVMGDITASVPVSIQPETELPPAGLPLTPQISPEPATTGEIQVVAHVGKSPGMPRPPSPISLHHASPRPQTDVPNPNTSRKERITDASVLQNLRTASGRNIKLSQKGQDAIETLKTSYTQPQIHKRVRRHAHALQLERAELGQQLTHAFSSARSIRTHRKHLLPPPDFWHQLRRHPEKEGFRRAADAEIKSLEEKGTFKLVDYPEDKQVLPLKWVFTYKLDDAGYLIRHKARICVRGDLQHHTGDDIYAATGAYRSFRILMALVCAFGLICHQIDFKNAFINAHMDEEVYTTCPPGYGKSGKVWKLRRALYGLRKSPKLWFNELVTFLQGLGFEYCPDEPCILINNETHLILFLYVDDLLVIAHQEYLHIVNEFKTAVHRKYGIKDLGEAISFLNIRILRDIKAKKLWISQDSYIDKLKIKFGIDQSMRTATPLISSYHPQPFEGQATIQQITEMQEKVGSILYAAVVSRPDVSFAASQLSQFTLNPSPEHLRYANRVLSYLQTTQYYAIEFSGSIDKAIEGEMGDDEVLQLSSDASFADDPETRKSTQGYLMKLFNGAIMWQSSKQKTVTTSTTEAELLSLSHTARETISLYRLFQQIEFNPELQPRILCDNQQTVGLIQKERPQLTSKLKHVDIHNFWLRQIHRDGNITVQWVPTTDMPADGFTKPLSAEKHSHFIKQLGLVDISFRIDPEDASQENIDDDIQMSSDTE